MSTVWALLLIAMRWPGAASLARWRSALGLSGMEIAAYGPPLSVVAASLGLLWVSTLVGLGAAWPSRLASPPRAGPSPCRGAVVMGCWGWLSTIDVVFAVGSEYGEPRGAAGPASS